jgi:hypothetical protein
VNGIAVLNVTQCKVDEVKFGFQIHQLILLRIRLQNLDEAGKSQILGLEVNGSIAFLANGPELLKVKIFACIDLVYYAFRDAFFCRSS